jgi:hypothetical protein
VCGVLNIIHFDRCGQVDAFSFCVGFVGEDYQCFDVERKGQILTVDDEESAQTGIEIIPATCCCSYGV